MDEVKHGHHRENEAGEDLKPWEIHELVDANGEHEEVSSDHEEEWVEKC